MHSIRSVLYNGIVSIRNRKFINSKEYSQVHSSFTSFNKLNFIYTINYVHIYIYILNTVTSALRKQKQYNTPNILFFLLLKFLLFTFSIYFPVLQYFFLTWSCLV